MLNYCSAHPAVFFSDMGLCRAGHVEQSLDLIPGPHRCYFPKFCIWAGHKPELGCEQPCQQLSLMARGDRHTSCCMNVEWSHYGEEEWVEAEWRLSVRDWSFLFWLCSESAQQGAGMSYYWTFIAPLKIFASLLGRCLWIRGHTTEIREGLASMQLHICISAPNVSHSFLLLPANKTQVEAGGSEPAPSQTTGRNKNKQIFYFPSIHYIILLYYIV